MIAVRSRVLGPWAASSAVPCGRPDQSDEIETISDVATRYALAPAGHPDQSGLVQLASEVGLPCGPETRAAPSISVLDVRRYAGAYSPDATRVHVMTRQLGHWQESVIPL